jgi:hypothetical protein
MRFSIRVPLVSDRRTGALCVGIKETAEIAAIDIGIAYNLAGCIDVVCSVFHPGWFTPRVSRPVIFSPLKKDACIPDALAATPAISLSDLIPYAHRQGVNLW